MTVDYPLQSQTEDLRTLWKEAFGDEDAFLDIFYTHGFQFDRCRCITENGKVVAALYWFDCILSGRPVAYLYAVATDKHHRGKGLCRTLLENTHHHLKYLGYDGCILVPGDEGLARMYEKMGYASCTCIREFSCAAAAEPVILRQIGAEEYCRLRRQFLPERGVIQEGDGITFFQNIAHFYAGEDFLAAVSRDEPSHIAELLGNPDAAPGILAALHLTKGNFRAPGEEKSFAMYYPMSDLPAPGYFGLAFD
jgi:predicted N-acetyltransferase YhbS